MIDERDLFERSAAQFDPPVDAFDRFIDRRERHERNQRIVAGVVTFIIALALAAAAYALRNPQQLQPAPPNAFDKAHGWIAVGGPTSVVAVDPTGGSEQQTLSDTGADAYGWSNDGSYLLVGRLLGAENDLFVIDGRGEETLVARNSASGSFSPDGRSVVYGGLRDLTVYEVPITGGSPLVLVKGTAANGYGFPIQSPDGSKIVYTRVQDGVSGGLWIMDRDGGNQHEVASLAAIDALMGGTPITTIYAMSWSPSSDEVAIGAAGGNGVALGILTVKTDGTDLRPITPDASGVWWSASWSPDGSEIAALSKQQGLLVMAADGSNPRVVQSDPAGTFIAWNPLPQNPETKS